MQNPFRRPDHNSLGSITLVRLSFISVRFSPPAANFYFARRQPHLGCVHLAAAIAHSSLISQSIAKVHLHSSATCVPCGKDTPVASYVAVHHPGCPGLPVQPLCGGSPSASITSYLLIPAAVKRLAIPTVRTSVPHGYASFLPQALLPEILKKPVWLRIPDEFFICPF